MRSTLLHTLRPVLRTVTAVAAVALLAGLSSPALAQDDLPFTVEGGVTFTTDYVFRGISQTDENPAVQGSLGIATESGISAGIWGSNVYFGGGDEAHVELDYSLAFANSAAGFDYSVGVYYYTYPGVDSDLDYDYVEFGASIGYAIDMVTPSAVFYYSPDFFGTVDDSYYLGAGLSFQVAENVALYGNIGQQFYDDEDGDDVLDWNVGVTVTLAGVDFDLRYTEADLDIDAADGRVVLSASAGF